MSRKKVTTKAKKSNKVKKQTKTSSSIQVLEKEFKRLPIKMIQQLRKETSVLKKQEKKLQSSLKKLESQKKSADKKQSVLTAKAQSKPSSAAKKKLKTIKKVHDKISGNLSVLTIKLNLVKQQTAFLSAKEEQYSLISKDIAQLDKQLANASVTNNKTSKKTKLATKTPQGNTLPIQDDVEFERPELADIEQ